MKIITKITIIAVALLLCMLIFPWMAIEKVEGLASTGLWFLAFFAVNPIVVIGLSIMAGTELRRLWWVPIAIAVLFPLLFAIAIRELVWDLYAYSVIYLLIGVFAMFGTYFVKRIVKKAKNTDHVDGE